MSSAESYGNRVSFPQFYSVPGDKRYSSQWDGYYSDAYMSACSAFPSDDDDISDATSLTVSDPLQYQQPQISDEQEENKLNHEQKLIDENIMHQQEVLIKAAAKRGQKSIWNMMCLLVVLLSIVLISVDIILKWLFFGHISNFYLSTNFAAGLKILYSLTAAIATVISVAEIVLLLKNYDGVHMCSMKIKHKLKLIYSILFLNELPIALCTLLLAIYGFSCRLQQSFLASSIPRLYCIYGLFVILYRFAHFARKSVWIATRTSGVHNQKLLTSSAFILCVAVLSVKIVVVVFAFLPYENWNPSVNEPFEFQVNYGTGHHYFTNELETCEQETEGQLAFCPTRKDRHLQLGHKTTFTVEDFNGRYFETKIACTVWKKDIAGNLNSFLPFLDGASMAENCWIKFGFVYDRRRHIIKYNLIIMVETELKYKICSDIITRSVNVPWTSDTVKSVVSDACVINQNLPTMDAIKSLLTESNHFKTPMVRCSDWCTHTPNCQRCVMNSLTYSNRPAADGIFYFASNDACTCPSNDACPLRQCQWTMESTQGCHGFTNHSNSSTCPRPIPREADCILQTDISLTMFDHAADNKLGPMTVICQGCRGLTAVRDSNLQIHCQ